MRITQNFLLLPSLSISVSDILLAAGKTIEEVNKTISNTGISALHYSKSKKLSRFIFEGLSMIKAKHADVFEGVDAILVASQTYDERIPAISTRIQSKFNLSASTFCIDIMDGCASFVKLLAIAKMLEDNGHKKILVIAGDLNSLITSDTDIGTKILFGDGLTATVLEADAHKSHVSLFNNGDNKGLIACCTTDNLMHMDGFEVFRFTRNVVPTLVKNYLESAKSDLSLFDLIALHQASQLVVSAICSSLKIKNKLSDNFNCGKVGNLGGASVSAWLSMVKGLESKGKLKMLAVGFGAGLSWGLASVLVELKQNEVFYVEC